MTKIEYCADVLNTADVLSTKYSIFLHTLSFNIEDPPPEQVRQHLVS